MGYGLNSENGSGPGQRASGQVDLSVPSWDPDKLAELDELLGRKGKLLVEYHRMGKLLNELRPEANNTGDRWIIALSKHLQNYRYEGWTTANRLLKFAVEHANFDAAEFNNLTWGVMEELLGVPDLAVRAELMRQSDREKWTVRKAMKELMARGFIAPRSRPAAAGQKKLSEDPIGIVRDFRKDIGRVVQLCRMWGARKMLTKIRELLGNGSRPLPAERGVSTRIASFQKQAEELLELLEQVEGALFHTDSQLNKATCVVPAEV